MRRSLWLFAATVTALCVCSCGKDPVLGKWTESQTGAMTIEFKPDGTAVSDVDLGAAAAQLIARNPLAAAGINAGLAKARENLKTQQATWKREGKIYKVNMTHPLTGQPTEVYWKLDGEKLLQCSKDGKPLAISFVRKAQ